MIYDELIEELALTLLTKARYEGCISVIDGFSQCEEDNYYITPAYSDEGWYVEKTTLPSVCCKRWTRTAATCRKPRPTI